ncbi:hypothetical protein GCM10027452_31100 [Micromonospora halotolerans]
MSDTAVVGLDVGGTSTRAAALTLDGVRLGDLVDDAVRPVLLTLGVPVVHT